MEHLFISTELGRIGRTIWMVLLALLSAPSLQVCPLSSLNIATFRSHSTGDSFTYKWRATQYGSGWYHSHFYVQAWDGVFGGIVINGPATSNYDEDLGNLFLNDWYHVRSPSSLQFHGKLGC